MRGTRTPLVSSDLRVGLIPTYAGNTYPRKPESYALWAHPHVCGEHMITHTMSDLESGSSPRMRGTQFAPVAASIGRGLIPTYAGNTCRTRLGTLLRRAHPHVCGEHLASSPKTPLGSGSSPRMRGTLAIMSACEGNKGLIPTYAGNTPEYTAPELSHGAHPHVCGEHIKDEILNRNRRGSSPRMRGTLPDLFDKIHNRGLIPTYAGNTRSIDTSTSPRRAHPHVCGEHTAFIDS